MKSPRREQEQKGMSNEVEKGRAKTCSEIPIVKDDRGLGQGILAHTVHRETWDFDTAPAGEKIKDL